MGLNESVKFGCVPDCAEWLGNKLECARTYEITYVFSLNVQDRPLCKSSLGTSAVVGLWTQHANYSTDDNRTLFASEAGNRGRYATVRGWRTGREHLGMYRARMR